MFLSFSTFLQYKALLSQSAIKPDLCLNTTGKSVCISFMITGNLGVV